MMMMMVHRDNRRRPFPSSQTDDESDGPTYDVVGGATPASNGGAAAAAAALRGAAAGGMTTSLGFPFTNAQWKELERQAMIYKYMVASLPVPRDLLFPNPRNSSAPTVSQPPFGGGGFNLRLSNNTDPEPGRCKRTDGKKWRCSREAAPDQKYCERHMHRGRPRSRKHVEVQPNAATAKRARHDMSSAPPPPTPATASFSKPAINKNVCTSQFIGSSVQQYHGSPLFLGRDCVKAPTFDSSDREPRSLDWLMMKGESIQMATSDQHWHHLMQSKTELSDSTIPFFDANSSIFSHRSHQESFLNLNSYTNFNSGEDQQENECNIFLNPDVISLESPMIDETPRFFIDAWSKAVIDDKDNGSAPSSEQLSPSSLTLSMGGYNSISEGMGQSVPQISLGSNGNGIKAPRLSTWLTPASWVDSAPGGPLAEVLKPTTSAASNPSSPVTAGANNGELGSRLTTAVSSPSGVVQKTFASVSDSSGNSSPTTLASSSRAKPEVVSLWLNQNKA